MLRRRDLMGKTGTFVYHWDYTMGSPLDCGLILDANGPAEMQADGFFLSASSASACVVSSLNLPLPATCPRFRIRYGFDINVKFKVVKDSGWSDLLSIYVFDNSNTYERCLAVSMNNTIRINDYQNSATIQFPSNNVITQRFVMQDGKLSAYFNEYAKENVVLSRTSSTEESHIKINISNNWYNKGTTSVLIESIDILLNWG